MKRIFLLLLLLPTLLAAPVTAQGPTPPDDVALAKVDQAVRDKIRAKGQADFWIHFVQQADLTAAPQITDWTARGEYVVKQLQVTADQSQAATRQELAQRHAQFQPFWVVNAIHVKGGNQAILLDAARRPEVTRVLATQTVAVPPVKKRTQTAAEAIDTVDWNINKIKAPQVWSTYNDRGQGIIVANIDTGVQFDHPALVRQYRGRLANGSFDHNYNWFDPSRVCGNPSLAPCDNNSHGTHTMGTIVGDDGAGNQIGVAPAAKWIAAKGCETNECSDAALIAAGQWMLAPTTLGGTNPRADLRPHVVNNSWGGLSLDTLYKDVIKAWLASGIFPVFSNGNKGMICQIAGAPGNYVESYAVGAFDQYDTIATFSSRGPSALDGVVKPNIAAPGVDVRSSIPDNRYAWYDGTSMAAPHVAGAVALLWSASSRLMGDINATRALLDQTAIDVNDTSCGGTTAKNNVWGEGKLDIYAAVSRATRDTRGTLSGTISNAASGAGILGATIAATGPLPQNDNRTTTSTASGAYSLQLPAGTYNITISAFGYNPLTSNGIAITAGATTTRNGQLTSLPRYSISGTVRDVLGNALGGVPLSVASAPIPGTTTDSNGNYTLSGVPQGTYLLGVQPGHCNEAAGKSMTVNGNIAGVNFALSQKMDPFGYTCQTLPTSFIPGSTKLALTGDDTAQALTLPFAFRLYGKSYTTASVSANGYISFEDLDPNYSTPDNQAIPDYWEPNATVYAFWDDLLVDSSAGVYTAVQGTAPNRQFIIEWRNVAFSNDLTKRVRFEIILNENGRILTQYADIAANSLERGGSATVGIENEDSFTAFQYSSDEQTLSNSLAIRFAPPVANLLKNPGFELDSDMDGYLDNWTKNDNFSYWNEEQGEVRNGIYSGRHQADADASYTIAQTVAGIVAGQKYSLAGWVNIPGNGDTFSFKVQVQWRNASNAVISTQVIETYTSSTGGWDEAASNNLVAPTGATNAQIQMVAASLKGPVYVDDFIFGK
jgi:hypothetical protein